MKIPGHSFSENLAIAYSKAAIPSVQKRSAFKNLEAKIITLLDAIFVTFSSSYRANRAKISNKVMLMSEEERFPSKELLRVFVEKMLSNKKQRTEVTPDPKVESLNPEEEPISSKDKPLSPVVVDLEKIKAPEPLIPEIPSVVSPAIVSTNEEGVSADKENDNAANDKGNGEIVGSKEKEIVGAATEEVVKQPEEVVKQSEEEPTAEGNPGELIATCLLQAFAQKQNKELSDVDPAAKLSEEEETQEISPEEQAQFEKNMAAFKEYLIENPGAFAAFTFGLHALKNQSLLEKASDESPESMSEESQAVLPLCSTVLPPNMLLPSFDGSFAFESMPEESQVVLPLCSTVLPPNTLLPSSNESSETISGFIAGNEFPELVGQPEDKAVAESIDDDSIPPLVEDELVMSRIPESEKVEENSKIDKSWSGWFSSKLFRN